MYPSKAISSVIFWSEQKKLQPHSWNKRSISSAQDYLAPIIGDLKTHECFKHIPLLPHCLQSCRLGSPATTAQLVKTSHISVHPQLNPAH